MLVTILDTSSNKRDILRIFLHHEKHYSSLSKNMLHFKCLHKVEKDIGFEEIDILFKFLFIFGVLLVKDISNMREFYDLTFFAKVLPTVLLTV